MSIKFKSALSEERPLHFKADPASVLTAVTFLKASALSAPSQFLCNNCHFSISFLINWHVNVFYCNCKLSSPLVLVSLRLWSPNWFLRSGAGSEGNRFGVFQTPLLFKLAWKSRKDPVLL